MVRLYGLWLMAYGRYLGFRFSGLGLDLNGHILDVKFGLQLKLSLDKDKRIGEKKRSNIT